MSAPGNGAAEPANASENGRVREPPWTWTSSWQKHAEEWAQVDDQRMWAVTWQRMGAAHGYITPPMLVRTPGPGGQMLVTATWVSSAMPMSSAALDQTAGCYAAWDKGGDAWGEAEGASAPRVAAPEPRAAGPYDPW